MWTKKTKKKVLFRNRPKVPAMLTTCSSRREWLSAGIKLNRYFSWYSVSLGVHVRIHCDLCYLYSLKTSKNGVVSKENTANYAKIGNKYKRFRHLAFFPSTTKSRSSKSGYGTDIQERYVLFLVFEQIFIIFFPI